MKIHFFDTLPSTNRYCELLSPDETEEFDVIVAREQTDGIGQRGNRWVSEAGNNLTFSIILKPVFLSMADQYLLTKAVALGVRDWLVTIIPDGVRQVHIKWPNDIYVGDKKIGGILTQNSIQHGHLTRSIVGIGINVNQTVFPSAAGNATSVRLTTGKATDLQQSLEAVIDTVERRYRQLADKQRDTLDADYLSSLYRLGHPAPYRYHDSVITATICGVNRYGHLLLRVDDGQTLTCQLKEIQFLPEAQ